MTDLKEGDRVPTVEAMEALPVGAAVTTKDGIKLTTRHPEGWSNHNNMGTYSRADRYWFKGMELVSLPKNPYDGPMIGDVITTVEQIAALPDGSTIIGTTSRTAFTASRLPGETYEGRWNRAFTDRTLLNGMKERGGTYVVDSLPVDLFETAEQFAARFRDLTLTGNERARGYANDAVEVLDQMKVPFRPTVGMRLTSRHDRDLLAQSTEPVRVYVGRPEDPDSFAIWIGQGGRWDRVFGRNPAEPREVVAVVIDAIGEKTEPDEWFVKEPTPEDAEEVSRLRAVAWKLGFAKKMSKGWCDEFERVMLRGGVTAECLKYPLPGGVREGQVVTVEQAAALMVGSTFKVVRNDKVVALFRRVEKSTNKAGTQRIWAAEGEKVGHYAEHMVLASGYPDLGDGVLAKVGDLTGKRWDLELAWVPVGTRVVNGSAIGGNVFEKVNNSDREYQWGHLGRDPNNFLNNPPPQYLHGSFNEGYHYIRIGAEG